MNRLLIITVLICFSVFGNLKAEACQATRDYPEIFEMLLNGPDSEAKKAGVESMELIAVTPQKAYGKDTEIFIKTRLLGLEIYLYQRMGKECELISQKYYQDTKEVEREIKRRKMRRL